MSGAAGRGFGSCCLVYLILGVGEGWKVALVFIEECKPKAVASVLSLLEIDVRPCQLERPGVAHKYEALLANFPNLLIAGVDREIARLAAHLRAEHGLRTPDALQAAASLVHSAKLFITNDRAFKRLEGILEVCVLDELRVE